MDAKLGQIFTFYSYKGGTGRSMALANVACSLADKWADGEKILMIDWDLEAPGLHRYFDAHLKSSASFDLDKQPGLIDLFLHFKESCKHLSRKGQISSDFFAKIGINKYILETDVSNLFLMTAGRFDDMYATKVNTFNWEELFNQNPDLLPAFANYLAANFKYILIDSRTGFTDTSSVCTSLMPEKLIVVFTPNRQSLTGVLELIDHSTNYRKNSDDLRPLVVFPLPSRIENAELDLQKDWRFGNKQKRVIGFQPQFEDIFKQVYDLPSVDLTDYFNDVQIQYVPKYSYGEEIAVLLEKSESRLSLSQSYENFSRLLVKIESPWEYQLNSISIDGDIGSNIVLGNSNVINVYIQGDVSGDTIKSTSKRVNRNLKVFLCHSSQDKPLVRDLYRRLNDDDFSVWFDEEVLLPGQDWNLEVEKAVADSDVVLVCLSSQSVTKEGYIQRELRKVLDIATEKLEGTVFIIPIRLNECEVPRRISYWQYLDYFPNPNRDKAYKRLKESLKIREKSLGLKLSKKK